MSDEKYIVLKIKSSNPDSYRTTNTDYWVCLESEAKKGFLKDNLPVMGIHLTDSIVADNVCHYLNKELDKRVDNKICKLFQQGKIELPFDFLESWELEDKDTIKEIIRLRVGKCDIVQCHFKSDLLVIHKPKFGEMDLCHGLGLDYETFYGANTFMKEDMILNVSKVRGKC